MANCFQRVKFFKEHALFVNQEPFKVKKTVKTNVSRDVAKVIVYYIFDDLGAIIFKAQFDMLRPTKQPDLLSSYFSFSDSAGRLDVTNKGADVKFRLFTTIYTILVDHLKTEKFLYLHFAANLDEPSRVKLYNTFFTKLETALGTQFLYNKKEAKRSMHYYLFSKAVLDESPMLYKLMRKLVRISGVMANNVRRKGISF